MPTHKCNSDCKGSMYKGLKINCHRCLSPTYLECIKDLHEMKNFLIFFEIKPYSDESEEGKKKYVEEGKKKIDSLLYQESLVEFICQSCKKQPYTLMKNKYEKRIELMQTKLNDYEKDILDGNNCGKINELQTEIVTLKSHIENQDKINEKNNTDMSTTLALLKSSFDSYKDEMEKNLSKSIAILNNSELSGEASNANPIDNRNVNIRPRGKNVVLNSNLSPDAPTFNISDINGNNNNNNDNLNQNKTLTGIYDIYIAKFEKGTTSENIVNKVLESTDISDAKLFHVQMLGGRRHHHNFASFKITTVDRAICQKILQMNWNPQNARLFKQEYKNQNEKRSHDGKKERQYQNKSNYYGYNSRKYQGWHNDERLQNHGRTFQRDYNRNFNNHRQQYNNRRDNRHQEEYEQYIPDYHRRRNIRDNGHRHEFDGYHRQFNGYRRQFDNYGRESDDYRQKSNDHQYHRDFLGARPRTHTYPPRNHHMNYRY